MFLPNLKVIHRISIHNTDSEHVLKPNLLIPASLLRHIHIVVEFPGRYPTVSNIETGHRYEMEICKSGSRYGKTRYLSS